MEFSMMRTSSFCWISLLRLSLVIAVLLPSAQVLAQQVTITSPGVADVRILASDDYAMSELGNPWNMDAITDLADYIPHADIGTGLSNVGISNGNLSFTINSADNAYFHLLSPGQCSTNPLGKIGQRYPIDSSTYRYLTIRLYTTQASELRVLWYTGCSYITNWVRSSAYPTTTGWNTIVIDMLSVTAESTSNPVGGWSAAPVTGLRIDPGYGGDVLVDWVTLTKSTPAGGTHAVTHAFGAGPDTHYSLFLDTNSDVFDGYVQPLVRVQTATQAATVESAGNLPGTYSIVGYSSTDWATLMGNMWDMDGVGDVGQVSDITLTGTGFSGGSFSGTTSGADPWFNLNDFTSTFDVATFRYLRLEFSRTSGDGLSAVFCFNTSGAVAGQYYFGANAGANVINVDLVGDAGCSGTIRRLRFIPSTAAGVGFSMDSVSLRSDGFGGALAAPTAVTAPGNLIINDPPHFTFLQPDERGGEDFASAVLQNPWNMASIDDIVSYANLETAQIYPNNFVDGVQGDFFYGVSRTGSDDPYLPVFFVGASASNRIDTSRYKNVVYRLLIGTEQDVTNGSVVRIIWQAAGDGDASPFNGDDQITFDGWQEYVQDMTAIELEPVIHPDGSFIDPPWHGMVNNFRIDPHEFSTGVGFYYDYIKITADDESNTQFAITYDLWDSDDDLGDLTFDLFYNTTRSTTGGTPIVTGLSGDRDSRVYLWDTTNIPNGTYYIYATVSDGTATATKFATGRMVVSHSRAQDLTSPTVSVALPTEGLEVKDVLRVKGYAADNIQIALVEVLANGTYLDSFVPSRFNATARALFGTYPDASNAGFNELISVSSLALGAHSIAIRTYDTGGNVVTTTIGIVRVAGSEPNPAGADDVVNEAPIDLPTPATLVTRARLNASKRILSISATGATDCTSVSIVAGESSAVVRDQTSGVQQIATLGGGRNRVSAKARKIRGLRGNGRRAKRIFLAATCDGGSVGNVASVVTSNVAFRPYRAAGDWMTHVGAKLR